MDLLVQAIYKNFTFKCQKMQNCTADFKYTLKDCPSVLTLTEVNICLHLLSVKNLLLF